MVSSNCSSSLSSHSDARASSFCPTHQKATSATLEKETMAEGLKSFPAPLSPLSWGMSQACGRRSSLHASIPQVPRCHCSCPLPGSLFTPSARHGHPEVQVLRPDAVGDFRFFSGDSSYSEEASEGWTHSTLQVLLLFFFLTNKVSFLSSFRLTEKLSKKFRELPLIPCPHTCSVKPRSTSITRLVHLLQSRN